MTIFILFVVVNILIYRFMVSGNSLRSRHHVHFPAGHRRHGDAGDMGFVCDPSFRFRVSEESITRVLR